MKNFSNYTEQGLNHILTFTSALADRMQEEHVDFSKLKADENSLAEVELEAIAFANRRKNNQTARSTFGETDTAEVDEIRDNIRNWLKRTNKQIRG